ncbi:S66 peptidase family protein [Acinetobacter piscicola]|uniref:S66 peptidase family protein n=1 Tax=Acinetobacter piscicola TaxID=2006115 RepID=UPI001020AB12|nr:LD-carboxypeptidase [Acinetobacter piscicola]RYL29282.1 LD-carboxypeptidase [Acinetobacter piscicola]
MHFRIVSPSACVDVENIKLAQTQLEQLGHQVSLGTHVFAQYRYLAGTVEQRLSDLKMACLDPEVDAIWLARGGSGAAMLVPYLENWILNKPIIGYSDATVLLNYVAMHHGQALHAPVFSEIAVKNLAQHTLSPDAQSVIQLLDAQRLALTSENVYPLTQIYSNHAQACSGQLKVLGGNLTVLCSLQGTSNALKLEQPSMLLLEDVGEPYYRIERALTQLLQSLDLSNLKALVLGDFYACPQKNVPQSIGEIVAEHLEPLNIPLYQCDWFGHGASNQPFWIGKNGNISASQLII